MALHSLYCADVPLRNCSLTHAMRRCRDDELCEARTLTT